jgi:recombination DNA repair RAD52 pathway protein
MMLTSEQVAELLKPIDKSRVSRDGKGFSHLEIWDVRRTMNRIFGFATWSARVEAMELISEREVTGKDGKTRWNVIYRAKCTLQLGDTFGDGASYTEWAAGDATNPTLADAHDLAIKTAESQALKRCAVNLGDQFGLSLYRNGSTEATVRDVVGREHADTEKVEDLLAAFSDAATEDDLQLVVKIVSELDLSDPDKGRLRAAYLDARNRIGEAVGAA